MVSPIIPARANCVPIVTNSCSPASAVFPVGSTVKPTTINITPKIIFPISLKPDPCGIDNIISSLPSSIPAV